MDANNGFGLVRLGRAGLDASSRAALFTRWDGSEENFVRSACAARLCGMPTTLADDLQELHGAAREAMQHADA
eukprot:5250029-Prymnesium_polylepis.1